MAFDHRAQLLAHQRSADSRRRGQVPLPEEANGVEIAFDGADPGRRGAMRSDEGRKLDAVIAGLPEEFREVLVLREMEDLSYAEIAAVCEVPIGTVMSRLARARAMLREKWMAGMEGARHVV